VSPLCVFYLLIEASTAKTTSVWPRNWIPSIPATTFPKPSSPVRTLCVFRAFLFALRPQNTGSVHRIYSWRTCLIWAFSHSMMRYSSRTPYGWFSLPLRPLTRIFLCFSGRCYRTHRLYRHLNEMHLCPSQQLLKFRMFPKPPRCWLTHLRETTILFMIERLGRSWCLPVTLIHLLHPPYLWCVPYSLYPRKYSHFATTQPSPSFPLAATYPAKWIRIPQRDYDFGCKQLDFNRLEPISFSTKDNPGINLGDALRKNCTRLHRRDDLMLQGTSGVISCRLLVRSLHKFLVRVVELTQSQVPRVPR
jgi:hypothetical protein